MRMDGKRIVANSANEDAPALLMATDAAPRANSISVKKGIATALIFAAA